MTRLADATWLLLALALAPSTHAEERILAFADSVAIQRDGSLLVSESLRVNAENDRIRRGIFRDFPTDYRDRRGQHVRVGFEMLSVTRDGKPEPWFTRRAANGVRVYIGDQNVLLAPREYGYVLRYRTTRQVGFFAEHDELYWNVTGNGWLFPIDAAEADVALPAPVPAARLRLEGWTGFQGSTVRAVQAQLRDGGGHIRATRALGPEEGLTLAFTFPKGIVAEPDFAQRVRWWAADNRGLVGMVAVFLLVWAYYLWRWWRCGRDPAPGVVMPEYEAPDDLPPSVLRYVRAMQLDGDGFVPDLLHLAERGFVRISHDVRFVFDRLREPDAREPIGAALMQALFADDERVALDGDAHKALGAARAQHRRTLLAKHRGRWFHRNGWSLAIGVVASLVAIVVGVVLQGDFGGVGVLLAILLSVAAGIAVAQLRRAVVGGRNRIGHAIGALVALVACAITGFGLTVVAGSAVFALVVAFALTNALFANLLPAYTPAGRKLLDRIEGFVTYLSVAEKDDLARMKAPPMTGERFAHFLPYAQALGVEDAWAGKLVAALGAVAAAEATRQSVGAWYHADNGTDFSPRSFASDVGSALGSAISSASTPPGSSSGGGYGGGSSGGGGGGGGGSSGGGGGGGGGGGW